MSTIGRIHSFESCGTVDGPGIRFIVFMQGCLMRCMYCHNRDTWDIHKGKEITVEEIINEAKSYRHFMNASGGGITCSGGEAMLQPDFVRDLFRAAKAERIHTCLDTNGYIRKHSDVIDEVLEATDLVMLDIKHINDDIHHDFIGVSNKRTLDFARYLQKVGQKTWIRYVIVPGYTDNNTDAHLLGEFIKEMDNIEKVELLPYHKLGTHKWEALGLDYPLEGVEPPSKQTMDNIVTILEQYHSNVKY
ncbi:pyruvate formate lyase 1-activating protein [Vibrio hepatarius]|uniref:pyruvate formate lyase 1-activating protein n=1 Tax=Vibrio hepatarius TaxID=171383 RepID=UPI001C08A7BD|nr:pyruvate formate lyase 1-activating protein [Vibrio hepatarius]MBU2897097.1 pyruvate formate lyase 1-activating protein [Vibrio hepatarius]